MAFNDDRGFSNVLRHRSSPNGQGHLMEGGDPLAVRGVCWSPWCHNWVEDLPKDKRCHERECDARLWEEAMKTKKAIRYNGTLLGRVDHLLVEPDFSETPDYFPDALQPDHSVVSDDMCCICKTAIKRPKRETCGPCQIAVRSDQFNDRRKRIERSKKLTKTRGTLHHKGLSGLKGVKITK